MQSVQPSSDQLTTGRTPPAVTVSHVDKTYPGATKATFDDLSVECPAGKITIIVGPSGCGKTTLLRCICGLETTTGGTIHFGERDVTKVDAEKRGVAMVFQNYALYPDKTVSENIAFPLRMAKVAEADIQKRIYAAARLVRIEEYMDRRPGELSGGQRQRVGIARAIVRGPDVLLMDEPLSNLDTKLRTEMRAELGALQRRIGATTVYVTHDQTEALTLADHLIVLRDGVVEQQGPADKIFLQPNSTFVADFMGRMNLFQGAISGGVMTAADGQSVKVPRTADRAETIVGFRPEEVVQGILEDAGLILTAQVTRKELLGTEVLVHAVLGETDFRARLPIAAEIGETLTVSVAQQHIHYFDKDGRRVSDLSG